MELGCGGVETEVWAELAEDGAGVVALDGEAAAPGGAIGRKGGEDHVAAGTECACDLLDVGRAIVGRGEEVKDGAVMPETEVVLREFCGEDVGGEPGDLCCGGAEAGARVIECMFGDVEDGEVGVADSEEIVDERGLAGADVEDWGSEVRRGAADECEGDLEVWAEPAALGSLPGGVDLLPVCVRVHEREFSR